MTPTLSNRLKNLCLVIGAIVLLSLYSCGAIEHAKRVNLDVSRVDQAAYLSYAENLYEANYNYVGGRNRMPVYPIMLSFLYKPNFTEADFFTWGKYFNIALSIALLPAIFWLLRQRFTLIQTLGLWLIITFTVFIFRAAYVQVELLFYFLNFCCFLLLWQMLKQPSWQLALLTGFTLGITHLTKASIAPAIAIFGFVFLLKQAYSLYQFFGNSAKDKPIDWTEYRAFFGKTILPNLISLILVFSIFLTTVFPYIKTSQRFFGQYFYNVNSTFYIWYDSWEDAKAGTRRFEDGKGYPQMPSEQIPSVRKYLAEHTAQQIFVRFLDGVGRVFATASQSYGYLKYIALYFAAASLLSILNFRTTIRIVRQHWSLLLFFLLYFTSYLLLYAWYVPIAGGNRFTLAQFMPLIVLLAAIVQTHHQFSQSGNQLQFKGITIFYGVVIGMVLFELYPILTNRIIVLFSGT